jgi:hypothetical protein
MTYWHISDHQPSLQTPGVVLWSFPFSEGSILISHWQELTDCILEAAGNTLKLKDLAPGGGTPRWYPIGFMDVSS